MADVLVPHFAFPLTLGPSGDFAVVEQDSLDEVAGSVLVLLGTVVGEREELPDYGIEDVTFGQGIDTGSVTDSIDEWEPRATVNLDVQIDSTDELVKHIKSTIEVNNG